MQLFLDETGYSGLNLLDHEQPLFTLATLGLNEEECKFLKQKHFGRAKMPELKHSILARRSTGQKMVLAFLDDLLSRKNVFRFYMVHKRFALTRKFVDHVIEPTFHTLGLNLYRGGRDISYAYAIYRVIPGLEGQEFFGELLGRFHDVLRARTPESIAALHSLIHSHPLKGPSADLLAPAKAYLDALQSLEDIAALPADSLDLSLPIALPLMSLWREDLGTAEPIHLYHDQSSAMAKHSTWWSYLTASHRKPYRAASGAIGFPIGIDRTEFVNSKDWAGVQLADVIAGAFNRACLWIVRQQPEDDAYGAQLRERLHRTEDRTFLWIFPGDTPDHLVNDDGNEAIAYVSQQLYEFNLLS